VKSLLAAMILACCAFAFVAPATAQELSGPCPVGKMVSDRQGNTGVVTDTDPVGCHVLINGQNTYYLSWMLHLAGKPIVPASQVSAIKPGRYTCYGGNPLQYRFLDINIKSATTYTDVQGKGGAYSYNPKTQLIVFKSGSFQGEYAKYLGKEGIGVASKPTTFFATLCDLEK
jgi:hypothetical protein